MKLIKIVSLAIIATFTLQAQVDVKEVFLTQTGGQKVGMDRGAAIVGGTYDPATRQSGVTLWNMDYSDFTWPTSQNFMVDGNITSVDIEDNFAAVGTTFQEIKTDYLYGIIGGDNANVMRYDMATNTWSDASMPDVDPNYTFDRGAALISVAERLYALRGNDTKNFTVFDMSIGQWHTDNIPNNMGRSIGYGGGLTHFATLDTNNKHYLYVIGKDREGGIRFNGSSNRNKFYRYDFGDGTTGIWDEMADVPDGRIFNFLVREYGSGAALTNDGKYVYMIAGAGLDYFLRYDPPSNSWSSLARTTGNIGAGGALAYVKGKIYALAGGGSSEMYIYDINGTTWTTATSTLKPTISAGGSLTYDGKDLYAFAGDNGVAASNQTWKYDLSTLQWEKVNSHFDGRQQYDGAALTAHRVSDHVYNYHRALDGVWSEKLRYSVVNPGAHDRFGKAIAVKDNGNDTVTTYIGAPGRFANGGLGQILVENLDINNLPVSQGNLPLPNSGGDPIYKSYGSQVEYKDNVILVADNDLPNHAATIYLYGDIVSSYTQTISAVNSIAIEGNLSATGGVAANLLYKYDGSSWPMVPGTAERANYGSVALNQKVLLSTNIVDPTTLNPLISVHFRPLKDDGTPVPNGETRLDPTGFSDTTGRDSDLYKDYAIVNDPANDQAIILDVPCGLRPTELVANEWAMISVPCGDGATATFNDLFGDDMTDALGHAPEYGESDTANWVIYEDGPNYTGKSRDNVLVDVDTAMKLEQGYWIISSTDVTLKADDNAISTRTPPGLVLGGVVVEGIASVRVKFLVSSSSSVKKIMVGNPYPRPFKWSNVFFKNDQIDSVVHPIDDPQFSGIVKPNAYVYDVTQSGQPYRSVATNTPGISDEIAPMQGFWIQLDANATNTGSNLIALPFEK